MADGQQKTEEDSLSNTGTPDYGTNQNTEDEVIINRQAVTTCCCTPNYKNWWSLLWGIIGVVLFGLNFLMLLEYDDIEKCAFTRTFYWLGLFFAVFLLFLAIVVKFLGKYDVLFNAHPVLYALKLAGLCCCGDYCTCYGNDILGNYLKMDGNEGRREENTEDCGKGCCRKRCNQMTHYREYASENTKENLVALLYLFFDNLMAGLSITLVATFLTNVSGHIKMSFIDYPWVVWPLIVGRPIYAVGIIGWSCCKIWASHSCEKGTKFFIFGIAIAFLSDIVSLYVLAYDYYFNCKICPQFFNRTTSCI